MEPITRMLFAFLFAVILGSILVGALASLIYVGKSMA